MQGNLLYDQAVRVSSSDQAKDRAEYWKLWKEKAKQDGVKERKFEID